MLVFAVGPNDAGILAEQLTGHVTPADLIALPKFRACIRLMIDGMSRPAFTMETIQPEPNTLTVPASFGSNLVINMLNRLNQYKK